MKKTLILLTICAIFVVSLVSCRADRGSEALAVAEDLLSDALELYEIYYGDGIPYNMLGEKVGSYYPADEGFIESAGFKNIDELKKLTKTVFSAGYSEVLFASALSGGATGDGAYYARYIDSEGIIYDVAAGTGNILVFSEYEPMLEGIRAYDFSTLKIIEDGYERVTIGVTINVYDDEGSLISSDEIDIDLVNEDGAWLIDSAAY